MRSDELIKIVEADGWVRIRVSGSHHHFRHPIKKGLVTVPHPKGNLPKGTINSVLRQAGLK
ncbi:addiction module toxin, HicA family [Pseudomonas sp. MWU13-2625]|uniref:Type II toxin-antitoxin system HicA family toxin n=1 Tax=Chromobacterium aquaticum TaxID=467180 RepID=A0ABV8ZSM1_9NEIS|nr:type II toxin-antitoxin system HicA family toxin [Chromobacterium aquaticum]MCD5363101.1 type II toxin-antitoxin system HicA family toxin [Chromobacterium aquaticum]RBL65320.1 addiction module toxin, HicA family [Pseudomonas sp. MWU13-2625]